MFPSELPDLACRALLLAAATIFNQFLRKLHQKILGANYKDWRGQIWPNWLLTGQIWPELASTGQIWPYLNFQATDLKFASEVDFHASRKPTGLDLGYLASKRPDLARTGQYWPDLARSQFSSYRPQICVRCRFSCFKKAYGTRFGISGF